MTKNTNICSSKTIEVDKQARARQTKANRNEEDI
jgi:hypothetical protein